MSDFDDLVAGMDEALFATFGARVIYRRAGADDLTISAIPDDPLPEDNVAGQWTVRIIRAADVPGGPAQDDTLIIDSIVYTIVAVRSRESDPLVRLYIRKDE